MRDIFTRIYQDNLWNSPESKSGTGSELKQTARLIKGLNDLIHQFNIRSILDVPCGDFNWMNQVNLNGIDYIGGDIVWQIVQENKQNYNHSFKVLDLVNSVLPTADLLICRDCLVHFSYSHIQLSIDNISRSGCKYLLTTTFPSHCNWNINTGEWRPINLQAVPFNFPDPILIINEGCTEFDGLFSDKSMALWKI
ncbi:MAG: class I SAM-dependent methyltransferase [Paludibacter sp.]|nr:class I SAM-dependent methyltransferase [Paludibacter sp.]